MTWPLIGGDPAPGDTYAIATAALALRTVANLTDEIADSMQSDHSTLTSGVWSGKAFNAYMTEAGRVLPQVRDARDSYTDAAGALDRYKAVLESEQVQARAALAKAGAAEDERAGAEQQREAAQEQANAHYNDYQQVARQATALQHQITATSDPGTLAALTRQLASLQAYGQRVWADHVDQDAQAGRYAAARGDAERRLADARGEADQIRQAVDTAADQLVQALKAAEHEANLPNLVERTWTRTKEGIQDYGPIVVSVLKVVAAGVALLSFAFPVLAPVALVLAGAVLLGDLLIATTDDDGWHISLSEGLGLGLDVLGVLGGVGVVLGTPAGVARLLPGVTNVDRVMALAASSQKWFDVAGTGLSITKGVVDGDPTEVVFAVGGVAAGKFAGPLVRQSLAKLNKNPLISAQLENLNRSIGSNPLTRFGEDQRATQSLLASTRSTYHGGQFLPGSTPTHSMTIPEIDEGTAGLREGAVDVVHESVGVVNAIHGSVSPEPEHY